MSSMPGYVLIIICKLKPGQRDRYKALFNELVSATGLRHGRTPRLVAGTMSTPMHCKVGVQRPNDLHHWLTG